MLLPAGDSSLLSQFPLAFWASRGADHGYRVEIWNDAAERMYGISREDAVGSPFTELFVSPVARDQAKRDADDVISGAPHAPNCLAFDQRPDGSPLILLTNVFRLVVPDGVLHAEVSVDLTKSEVAKYLDEQALRNALASPHRTIDFLIAEKERIDSARYMQRVIGMAHEVRTEIATVRQLLESGPGPAAQPIVEACDRAGVSIATLLVHSQAAASRGTDGSVVSRNQSFSPDDVIRRVTSRYATMRSSIEVAHSSTGRGIKVRGNLTDFELALSNVLSNAVRHSAAGTTVRVSIHVFRPGRRAPGWISVLVSNVPLRELGTVSTALANARTSDVSPSSRYGLSVVTLLAQNAHARFHVGVEGRYVIAKLDWPVEVTRR